MRKSFRPMVLGIMLVLVSLFIMSCKDTEKEQIQLNAPSNVAISNNVVTWNAVELANGYSVNVAGTDYKVQTTSYTILINQPGTYEVKVRADGKDHILTSAWSSSVNFVVEEPEPIVYMISETFDLPSAKDEWNLGSVQNMHDVENGQLILRNTGLVPYPSRGKNLKVTLSEYPYLAVKVDDLGGSNARWAIKILMAGDATSNRSVTPNDMTSTGLFFFDLTKVEGLEDLDYAEFDLYIYIIESEGNYIKIDYLQSVSSIPGTNNFDNTDDISVTGGNITAEHGVLNITSSGSGQAVVSTEMYIDPSIANMIDLYVSQIGESSTFSLKIDGKTVIQNATRYGHFGIDLEAFDIDQTGIVDIEFTVNGSMSVDRIANVAYSPYVQTFEGYDDESIYDLVTLSGSADISVNDDDELVIYRLSALVGDAKVTFAGTSNFSTYPKFTFEVTAIDQNATLRVLVNNRLVGNITTSGEYNFDLTSVYQTGYRKINVEFMLIAEGNATATVSGFSFVRDENLSKNALPEKGDRVELEGSVIEEGYNSDNWGGDAIVFSRNGQIWIANSGFFSKGEVFGKNIDLEVNRFLNIKLDEITQGSTWKLDVIYDVGSPTERKYTVQNEINTTGIFSYDLYHIMGLNTSNKTTQRLSISFFIIGGNDKIAKIDYINLKQTPDATNEIIMVKPVDNMIVPIDTDVLVSATLKFPLGNVVIIVEKDNVDVTSTVLVDGVFSTSVEGLYTITYSFEDVTSVVRTVTVTSAPVVITDNTSTTINYDQSLDIIATVDPDDGSTITYQAFLGEVEVTDSVFTALTQGVRFKALETGNYRIVMKSETTEAIEINITVVTGWTSEASGNNQNAVVDGNLVLSYSGNFYWPKHEKTVTVTNEAPFLVIDVASITGGTWKVDIDLLMNNAVPENAQSGLRIIDLRTILGQDAQKDMKFVLLIVGANVRLELNTFTFMSEEDIAQNYNSIVNVVPNTDQAVSVNTPFNISAALKYPIAGEIVAMNVFNASDENITSSVLASGVLTFTVPGIYEVVFSSPYAESITRVFTVVSDEEPILSTTNNTTASIGLDVDYDLAVDVENPVTGKEITYVVTKDGGVENLASVLIVDGIFSASVTGVYTVTASYEGALDLVQTITVVSGWTHEVINNGGSLTSSFSNDEFALRYAGQFYWPTLKYQVAITTDLTPYVVFNVNAITGGTWKMQLGDPYHVDVIAEGTRTGLIIIDLRTLVAGAGYGETSQSLNMTFTIYIVGGNVELKLTPFEALTASEVAQRYNQIINVTPQNNMSILPDAEVSLSAALKYPIVGETVNVTVKNAADEDVTSTTVVSGTFKTSTPGIYTVIYENEYADAVTRTIEVVSLETPILSTTNQLTTTIIIDEDLVLDIDVENPVVGESITVSIFKDGGEIDLSSTVFNVSTMTFNTNTTGNYQVVVSYEGAVDLILEVIVKTSWIPENFNNGGTLTVSAVEGVISLKYTGGFYWPTTKYVTPVTTDTTPYLVLNIASITGGTWKMELGDPYRTTVITEGTTSGQIIIDIRDHVALAGYGETSQSLNMTLTFYIIGENVELKITSVQFLTQAQRDLLS